MGSRNARKERSEAITLTKSLYQSGKHLAQKIFLESMAAIDVRRAMLSSLKREGRELRVGGDTIAFERPPRVVAFGKAANRMTSALAEVLGGEIEAGVVVAPSAPHQQLDRFRYFVGGHPYPNSGSLEGAKAVLDLLSGLSTEDVVIFLISGGGSAILDLPLDPSTTLTDLAEFNRVLVTCGLPIEHINVLRKHVSAIKGGRLAVSAYPARQVTVFISDVPDHLHSMVASGPTMPDESTTAQCYALAGQHNLAGRFPASIHRHFEQHTLEETPKPGDERFANSRYFCLLSNRNAVEAAESAAEREGPQGPQGPQGPKGLVCEIDSTEWDRDYREAARSQWASLEALAKAHPSQPVCLVSGGEVTCRVTGAGVGGRNQAFVLEAAGLIAGQKRVVLSAGTDGRDGNSPAAGAVADGDTLSRARALGLDPAHYAADSDSYHFFRTLGDTLDIGFTDNNVRDLRLWFHLGC